MRRSRSCSLKASLPKEPAHPFKKALTHPKNGTLAVIAEVKLASPSARELGSADELASRAKAYAAGGADALSIVTEKPFFKGDPAFVRVAKEAVRAAVGAGAIFFFGFSSDREGPAVRS